MTRAVMWSMLRSLPPTCLASFFALAAAGCVATTGDQAPEDGVVEGKLSSNGLVIQMESVARLTSAPLGTQSGSLVALDGPDHRELLAAPGGEELTKYLSLCAMPEGTDVELPNGTRYAGLYGLAPEWATETCGESCQRWVTGCVLAHANYFGTPVVISARGAHPGFSWDAQQEAEFTVQEAAFYGNIFDGQSEMLSCIGRAYSATDGDATENPAFYDRLCSASGLCDIQFTGVCRAGGVVFDDEAFDELGDEFQDTVDDEQWKHAGSACLQESGETGYYGDCKADSGDPRFEGPVREEVVTVYLR